MNLLEKPHNHIAATPIDYQGKTLPLKDWCHILDLDYDTVRMRYTRGMESPVLFAPTLKRFSRIDKRIVLTDSIFERLEHHGRRLLIAPNTLAVELIEHGLRKLDKSEQSNQGE